MITVAEKNTVKCLEGFSFLSFFACFFRLRKFRISPRKSSVVLGNLRQSLRILSSLRKSSEITGIVAEEGLSEV